MTSEQTPLAKLIQRREELIDRVKRRRRQLNRGDYESISAQEHWHEQRVARWTEERDQKVSELDRTVSKLTSAIAFEVAREAVIQSVYNEELRTMMEKISKESEIDQIQQAIPHLRQRIEELDANLAETPVFEDHKVEITNQLAEAEVELKAVKADIRKEMRRVPRYSERT